MKPPLFSLLNNDQRGGGDVKQLTCKSGLINRLDQHAKCKSSKPEKKTFNLVNLSQLFKNPQLAQQQKFD